MTTQAAELLAEYSADHQHPVNRLLHSICVPVIFIALVGLLAAIPLPGSPAGVPQWLNIGTLALGAVSAYYLHLAPRLGTGMVLAGIAIVALIGLATTLPTPLWLTSLIAFSIGWVGQFVGHYVEGRRPSFFRDLRFLLIGPLWVLAKLYAAIGLRA